MPSKNRSWKGRVHLRCAACKKHIPVAAIKWSAVSLDGTELWFHDECGKAQP